MVHRRGVQHAWNRPGKGSILLTRRRQTRLRNSRRRNQLRILAEPVWWTRLRSRFDDSDRTQTDTGSWRDATGVSRTRNRSHIRFRFAALFDAVVPRRPAVLHAPRLLFPYRDWQIEIRLDARSCLGAT